MEEESQVKGIKIKDRLPASLPRQKYACVLVVCVD